MAIYHSILKILMIRSKITCLQLYPTTSVLFMKRHYNKPNQERKIPLYLLSFLYKEKHYAARILDCLLLFNIIYENPL